MGEEDQARVSPPHLTSPPHGGEEYEKVDHDLLPLRAVERFRDTNPGLTRIPVVWPSC